MRCLCCGKETLDNETWHPSCVKKFFGSSVLPEISLSDDLLLEIAKNSVNKGITVTGVQKKLSLHLDKDGKEPRLTMINYPSGYILKPQTEEYEALPEAEYLVMEMALATHISTVPHALMKIGKDNERLAFITKRIDRLSQTDMLAMEDFCQLDERLTEDKYKGSYERCAKIIDQYSFQPGVDKAELFMRLVFCFVTGNSDMHLKNFSLIETSEASGKYKLSAAYDLLPVSVILPEDTEQTALTLNGKKKRIKREDFLQYADSIGVPQKAANNMIKKVTSMKEQYIKMCEESYMPEQMKESLKSLIENRVSELSKSI